MTNETTQTEAATMKPADQIRTALKAKGISRKQVSVRHDHYSMGSSIYVVVRDPAVRLSVVREIAKEQEHVDYCQYSGEILSGGNRFVDVSYSADALAPLVKEIAAELAMVPGDGTVMPIRNGAFRAVRVTNGVREERDFMCIYRPPPDERETYCFDSIVRCCCGDGTFPARQLAEYIVDQPEAVEAVAAPELDAHGEAVLALIGA